MISTAPPPPKAGANGVRGGQGGSGDGCCDNVGSRARELIDRVPPCTSKYAFALQVPLEISKIIGIYITGTKPIWESWFYHKDASHFKCDEDLRSALSTAQDFTFTYFCLQ